MSTGSASGKIILSGEYAVIFGHRGIAVPSSMGLQATFSPTSKNDDMRIEWNLKTTTKKSGAYAKSIADLIRRHTTCAGGFLIDGDLPVGKGMGASTALVIAMCRAALGDDCESIARKIEDTVNPGHSGLDFAVIWSGKPVVFKKGETPKPVTIDLAFMKNAHLIDTGTPNETTPELVAWVKQKYVSDKNYQNAIEIIGHCTDRLLAGESIASVMRDHHRAQVTLGVVPKEVQTLIADIEAKGESAKTLGAGARTGGGGMVLAID